MEIQQLRVFLGVVEGGSLRAAAVNLHVTPAAISRSLSGLERRLGVVLVTRSHAGAYPTAAGVVLLEAAQAVIHAVDGVAERIAEYRAESVLRLATFDSVSAHYLPGLLARLRSAVPGLVCVLRDGSDTDALCRLNSGDADAAFVSGDPGGATVHPLYTDDFVIVTASARGADSTPIPLAELSEDTVVVSSGGCGDAVEFALRSHRGRRKPPARVGHVATALGMAGAGIADVVVPRHLAVSLPAPLVARETVPTITRRIGLAVRAGEQPTVAVAALLAAAHAAAS